MEDGVAEGIADGLDVGLLVAGVGCSVVGLLVGDDGAAVGANVGGLLHVVSPVGSQAPVVIPLLGTQLYSQVPD